MDIWYARCDSNARPLESEGFVVTIYPLITASKVQFLIVFRISSSIFQKQTPPRIGCGRQANTSRSGFSDPIMLECAIVKHFEKILAAAGYWDNITRTLKGKHRTILVQIRPDIQSTAIVFLSVSVSKNHAPPSTVSQVFFLKFRYWNWFTVKVALSQVAADTL